MIKCPLSELSQSFVVGTNLKLNGESRPCTKATITALGSNLDIGVDIAVFVFIDLRKLRARYGNSLPPQ
jgi:hypothetical protein